MEFIKSRWSSTSNGEVQTNQTQTNQTQPIETSYNSVTFTNGNTQSNPIIISTQHPSQISIIHEVRSSPDMASPTDSFHSVVSTFPNERQRDGKVNLAFTGSNSDMNNQQHHRTLSQQQAQRPQN